MSQVLAPDRTDDRLIVALDVPDAPSALDLAQRLGPAVSFYKIGLGMLTGGGLAAAMAAHFRAAWGDAPTIAVVEPTEAPCLLESVLTDGPAHAPGEVSVMGRLDCKKASLPSLKGLPHDADHFATISDEHATFATHLLT